MAATTTTQPFAVRPSRIGVILAFAAVYIIWGSTYIAIRYAIETLPPFLMAASRFLIAGVILLGWSRLNGNGLSWSFAHWRRAFLIGFLLLLCGNGGVTWAEKYIPSSLAALAVATEPLWVVVLNWILTRKRPNAKVLVGVLIGVAGVGLLVSGGVTNGAGQSNVTPTMSFVSLGVVLAASLAWAAGSVYSSRRPIKAPTSLASGMQMLAGGSLLLLFGLLAGDSRRLNLAAASWISLSAFAYLVVFGSLVAFTAYSWLLRNVTPARAATYAYVNPVVAVLLGWFLASEPLTLRMMAAAAVIVCSVVLITTYGSEHAQPVSSIHDSECPTHPCA